MSFYNNSDEYSIDNSIINNFKTMSKSGLQKCIDYYIANYELEPTVYGNYLAKTWDIWYNTFNIVDKYNMTSKIIKLMPLECIIYISHYHYFELDSIRVINAFNNKDKRVFSHLLNNYHLNYITHCNILDDIIANKLDSAFINSFYDILFSKYNKIPITPATISNSFVEKYSNYLLSLGINIKKIRADMYYRALFLVKADNIDDTIIIKNNEFYNKSPEYDVDVDIIRKFSTMTKKGLYDCCQKYISNYYEEPSVYNNYMIVCLYYYYNDTESINIPRNLDHNIFATMPLDIIKFMISQQYLFKLNFNVIFSILQNKNVDILPYVLNNYDLSYNTHYFVLNHFMNNNKDKQFTKIYDVLFSKSNPLLISNDFINSFSSFKTKFSEYLKHKGITITTRTENKGHSLYFEKSSDKQCFVHNYKTGCRYIKFYNIEEKLAKYQLVSSNTLGEKYYVRKNNKITIFVTENVKQETYMMGFLGGYDVLSPKIIKKIYIV